MEFLKAGVGGGWGMQSFSLPHTLLGIQVSAHVDWSLDKMEEALIDVANGGQVTGRKMEGFE